MRATAKDMNELARVTGDVFDDVAEIFTEALNHLTQYATYAEEMRSIGRGMEPSSPYSPEYMRGLIMNRRDKARKAADAWREVARA